MSLVLSSALLSTAGSLFWTIFNLYLWDIGFSLLNIALLNVIPSILSLILSRYFGILADLTRKKPFIVFRLFLILATYMAFSFFLAGGIINFQILVPLFAVLGIAGAIGGGALLAAVTTSLEKIKTGQAAGTYLSFNSIGWAIGSFLSGYMADTIGMKNIFMVSSLLVFVSIIVVIFGYQENGEKKNIISRDVFLEAFKLAWSLRFKGNKRKFSLLIILTIILNIGTSLFFLAFIIKFYIMLGTKTLYGIISGIGGTASMIAPYLVGRISDKTNKETILVSGIAIRSMFMLYLSIFWDKVTAIIFWILPIWSLISVSTISLVTDYTKEGYESESQSIYNVVAGASSTIGNILSGIIATIINLRQNIMLIYIILTSGTLLCISALCIAIALWRIK